MAQVLETQQQQQQQQQQEASQGGLTAAASSTGSFLFPSNRAARLKRFSRHTATQPRPSSCLPLVSPKRTAQTLAEHTRLSPGSSPLSASLFQSRALQQHGPTLPSPDLGLPTLGSRPSLSLPLLPSGSLRDGGSPDVDEDPVERVHPAGSVGTGLLHQCRAKARHAGACRKARSPSRGSLGADSSSGVDGSNSACSTQSDSSSMDGQSTGNDLPSLGCMVAAEGEEAATLGLQDANAGEQLLGSPSSTPHHQRSGQARSSTSSSSSSSSSSVASWGANGEFFAASSGSDDDVDDGGWGPFGCCSGQSAAQEGFD